jgi:hypothetical protein
MDFYKGRACMLLAASFIFGSSALGQKYPSTFPRDASTKADESQCFLIWNVIYESGKSTGMRMAALDQVTVFWTEGSVKFTRPDGTWTVERERVGSIRYESKGTVEAEEGISETPSRAVVFQLKDVAPPIWPVTDGVPDQLPRAGAVKLFETGRVIVWDQTFGPGVPGPRHQHYKSTAGVWLAGGRTTVTSDPIDGAPVPPVVTTKVPGVVVNHTGLIKAPHREEELEGAPRIIYVEFK